MLDRFRVDQEFTGGMGLLWAVTDAHTGRRYAIKTIKPELSDQQEVLDGFLDQARTWIALDRHPHLVQAFWLIEETADGPFLVLEFVDGCNLAELLEAEGPLPVARALDLAMQCAAGLSYAHTKQLNEGVGVVHRDIKPSNLLVGADDQLKVSDFGLARILRSASEPTHVAGTPAYLAPEQVRPGSVIDGRTDIYAFGLVLYEMLVGTNPLEADTLPEQIERVLHETPPPLVGVSPGISALVARCTAKDPGQRPRSFTEVLAHLGRAARELDHAWHVDPHDVGEPSEPVGIAVGEPVLRPRRPVAGEPFSVSLEIQGDMGPGPVDVDWDLSLPPGIRLLTPPEGRRIRVEAGGLVRLHAPLDAITDSEGDYAFPVSHVSVRGPSHASRYPVVAFQAPVAMSFVLPWVAPSALRAQLVQTMKTPGGALLAFGTVGAGKSRLLIECATMAAELDRRVVRSRADATGMRPMRVLNDLARELLEISAGPAHGVRAAVNDVLGQDPSTARYFAGVLLGGSAIEAESPLAHRWYALLEAAAKRQPIVVLLDDLPHADEVALRVLYELAARVRRENLPVSFIATARDTHDNAAAQYRYELLREWTTYESIDLRPLGLNAIAKLLESVFPGSNFDEEAPWILRTIASATKGNPLYVVEILRTLRRDPTAIALEDGAWRVSATLTPESLRASVPSELAAVVARRLTALSRDARIVLRFAGVLGEEFDVPVLKTAVGDEALVDRALADLEDAMLVRPTDEAVDRYRFPSGTIPTVVRRAIPTTDRKRIYRRCARAFLQHYTGESRVRRGLAIAHMLRASGAEEESLPFTLLGCHRLLSLQLNDRARRLLSNARPILDVATIKDTTRARYWYLYGLACEATGAYDEGLFALNRFLEMTVELENDRRSLPRAHLRLGRIHQARGEYLEAQFAFSVARELYEVIGDYRRLAFVMASIAELALDRGDPVAASRHLEVAKRLAEDTGNEGAAVTTLNLDGRSALLLGETLAAHETFLEAEKRARALGDRQQRARALVGLARSSLELGYMRKARMHIEEAIDLFALMGSKPELAGALLHKGDIERGSGRADRALANYRRAQRAFMAVGRPDGIATAHRRIGCLMHLRGDITRAIRELALAAEQFGELHLPDRYPTLRELGTALLDNGSERAARVALARANRKDRNCVGRVLTRVSRARFYLDAGELDRAQAWVQRAVRNSVRTTGHVARIWANLVAADVAVADRRLHDARRSADTAAAFAREQGDPLAAAHAEQVLLELAARAGRFEEASERAHRAARAYTGRHDVGDAPARLLWAMARSWEHSRPTRAAGLRRAAERCFARLERRGHRIPPRFFSGP